VVRSLLQPGHGATSCMAGWEPLLPARGEWRPSRDAVEATSEVGDERGSRRRSKAIDRSGSGVKDDARRAG
jgi:hypothetical protein